MLNVLREGAKSGVVKFILFGFLVMAVAGLVLMDVQGVYRGGISRNTVASINGDDLGAVEFDRMVRRVLQRQGIDPVIAHKVGFINQILQSEINNNLMNNETQRLGINVSDKLVVEKINGIISPFITEEMPREEALRRLLLAQGMTEGEFVKAVRGEISNNLVRNAIIRGTAYVSDKEATDLYLYENESRGVRFFVLANEAIKDIPEIPEEVLQSLYEAGKERYAIPETRQFSIATVTRALLKQEIQIPEEEIRADYDNNIESYKLPERRVMDQAILNSQSDADEVVSLLGKGKSLKEAVNKQTGGEDAYLGTETFEKDGLAEEIASIAFEAEKNATVGPVQSALGWHVMVVKDILPPKTSSYDEVKDKIREELTKAALEDQLFSLANAIDDRLAGGAALEEIAAELKIEIKPFGPVREDGSTLDHKEGLPGIADADRSYVLQTVFEILEGEIAPVMELSDGNFAIIRTDAITPKSYKSYEDVRESILDGWKKDQQQMINQNKAQDMLKDMQAGIKTMEDFAKAENVTIQTMPGVSRKGEPPAPLNGEAHSKLFDSPVKGFVMASSPTGFILGQVLDLDLPEAASIKEEDLKPIIETASKNAGQEFVNAYLGYLRGRNSVKVNAHLLDTMYGPGNELY